MQINKKTYAFTLQSIKDDDNEKQLQLDDEYMSAFEMASTCNLQTKLNGRKTTNRKRVANGFRF